MEDVLGLIYANRHAYGLPQEEVATGRLLSKKHAQELRNYKLLSDYYYGREWRTLNKERRVGFFLRGVNKEGEYCYLTGVKEGTGIRDNFSLFYAATRQTVDTHTVHGTAFNAVDAYYFVRDVHAFYKADDGDLLNEPQYILNRDNSFDSYVKADVVELGFPNLARYLSIKDRRVLARCF